MTCAITSGALHLVIVSLYAPPATASAVRRPAGLTRHLTERGHRVTVVTSAFSGRGAVPGAARTVRTRDLLTTPVNWRRDHLDAVRGLPSDVRVRPPSPLARYLVPDVQVVSWLPFLAMSLRRVLRAGPVDGILTSGPPHSCHLAGLEAARRGIPWIAELRDGWGFERGGPEPASPVLRMVDRRLERKVMCHADAVIAVSPPLVEDVRARFGVRAEWVPLAYDPTEMANADRHAAGVIDELIDPARHTLLYTGSILAGERTAEVFLDGVAALARDPPAAASLQVLLVGPLSEHVRAGIATRGLEGIVEHHGSVSRARALKLQRQADSLLVLVDPLRPSILTNKLVEYLVTTRPILVLGRGSVAGVVATEENAGLVVGMEDPTETTAALRKLVAGTVGPRSSTRDWSYPQIALRLAGLFEELGDTRHG